ncbi:MAG: TSUP family transporter [Myxococcota bacterium]
MSELLLPPLAWPSLFMLMALTVVGAWVQGSIGLGFAIVTVPTLFLVDPRLAPAPQILVVLPLTALMALREWRSIQWRGMLWIIAGRLPGLGLGMLLLGWASRRVLDLVIGSIVMGTVVILARGLTLPRTRETEVLAGLFSGISAMVSSIGGPPIALLYQSEKGSIVRATLSGIFFVGVTLTIFGRWASGHLDLLDVRLAAWSLPGLLLGLGVSRWTLQHVEGPLLRAGVLSLSAVAAALLWVRGLSSA